MPPFLPIFTYAMSFVLSVSATYKWPVTVEIAADGGGRHKFTFDAEFKRLPSDEVKRLLNPEDGDDAPTDEDFCRDNVVGWSGVKDDEGSDVLFSQESLNKLLQIHPVPAMIVKAWIDSISGAKQKN
jgi:hypothetical protein